MPALSPETEPNVLIVGAGPAGLAAAIALASAGIEDILVIDRDDKPGGLPRFCHHIGFGLEYFHFPCTGPGFVARLLKNVPSRAVRIECATTLLSLREGPVAEVVGPRFGLRQLRPRAVIVATGIREGNRGNLCIPGGRAEFGIMTAGHLQQLAARRVMLPDHMRSVVVIGTEHVGFSSVLTARRAGLSVKAILGEEDRVMSFPIFERLARSFGIEVVTGIKVQSIETAQKRVRAVRIEERHGSREIPCDAVVLSANWRPETNALLDGPVKIDSKTRGPVVDQALRTTCRGVFAAGNVLHGVETSGWCAIEGAHAGAAVGLYLHGKISDRQGRRAIGLSPDIEFMVPQMWDSEVPSFAPKRCLPVTLRVARDLCNHRLVLRDGNSHVPLSRKHRFLRRRRSNIVPAPFDTWGDGEMLVTFLEDL